MSHSKGSIMVLGCISVSGVEDLLKLDELEKKRTIRFLQYMQHNLETIQLATYSVFRKNMMQKKTVKACLDRKTYIIEQCWIILIELRR